MSKIDYTNKKIEGFEGPYINQYLPGMAVGPGEKKFSNLEEAIKCALKMKNCSGITLSRQGKFTLRFQRKLKDSDTKNRFKNNEISWIKILDNESVKPEPKKKVINEIFSVSKKTKGDRAKKEEIFEIIKYNRKQFYYNCERNVAYDFETMKLYKFRRGKLFLVE